MAQWYVRDGTRHHLIISCPGYITKTVPFTDTPPDRSVTLDPVRVEQERVVGPVVDGRPPATAPGAEQTVGPTGGMLGDGHQGHDHHSNHHLRDSSVAVDPLPPTPVEPTPPPTPPSLPVPPTVESVPTAEQLRLAARARETLGELVQNLDRAPSGGSERHKFASAVSDVWRSGDRSLTCRMYGGIVAFLDQDLHSTRLREESARQDVMTFCSYLDRMSDRCSRDPRHDRSLANCRGLGAP